jgi:hypothetical protein
VGAELFPCLQTDKQIDGHDKGNNRFSQFCERAKKGVGARFGETRSEIGWNEVWKIIHSVNYHRTLFHFQLFMQLITLTVILYDLGACLQRSLRWRFFKSSRIL